MRKSMWLVLAVVLVVALVVSGCATKKFVQQEVANATKATDAKIGEVQKQVEANQMDVANLKKSDAAQTEQIGKLSDTAKEALARAQEAGKLAKGKILYEVTLTDEAVKFGFDQKALSKDAKAALDAFAARLKSENKGVYVEVQGHTDSVGSEQYNLSLFSHETGGELFSIHDPDDLKEAIARVDTELRYQYLIGYQPSIKQWQWNGKFREVRLETRRGSLSVRTRKGYYAMP